MNNTTSKPCISILAILFSLLLANISHPLSAQTYSNVFFRIDTTTYSIKQNAINYHDQKIIPLRINNLQEIVDVSFYPDPISQVQEVQFYDNAAIDLVDTIVHLSNGTYSGKFKFHNLQVGNPQTLLLKVKTANAIINESIQLMPYQITNVTGLSDPIELVAGEDKTIELNATNASNLQFNTLQESTPDFDYSIITNENAISISLHPKKSGLHNLVLTPQTKTLYLNDKDELTTKLPPISLSFNVKPSRLYYVNLDKSEFYIDNHVEDYEEVQMGPKCDFEVGKVYRIENRLEPGGKLIAEFIPKAVIADTKMLCVLYPYSLHSPAEGYLYIKQGNEVRYLTNFTVTPKPTIEHLALLHDGEDWTTADIVHPGETLQVRVEGKGLTHAKINFSNCINIKQDTARIFDDVLFYSIKVPTNINKKVIYLEINHKRTKVELVVKENLKPRNLDFVTLATEGQNLPITSLALNKPLVDQNVFKSVVLQFNPAIIDQGEELYGKQYLDLEIKVYSNKNELTEIQHVENIVICPDQASVRSPYYDRKDAFRSSINLNDYLTRKTYELEGWTRIEIVLKHAAGHYNETGYSRKVVLIKRKITDYNLEVSFPAGLLTKRYGANDVSELNGLSMAFLGQMSFYEKNNIKVLHPLKLGAGFMVLNLLSPATSAAPVDVGAVVIASLLPMKQDSKFNFPIYFGTGYLFRSGSWFSLVGPGVQFNF